MGLETAWQPASCADAPANSRRAISRTGSTSVTIFLILRWTFISTPVSGLFQGDNIRHWKVSLALVLSIEMS